MPRRLDPWEVPEWNFIRREALLARHLIGSGVTALGRANYADKMGEYYTAFFGLSLGMERLAKLILVADYVISNQGVMPTENLVKKYGHNLVKLFTEAEKVAVANNLQLYHARPTSPISTKITKCLDEFADASKGRYANYAALRSLNLGQHEPIKKWWDEVAELILKEHYYGRLAQKRVEENAEIIDAAVGPFSLVQHTNEIGGVMDTVLSSSIRTGQNEIVQKYGRFYSLLLVRWLSGLLSELARAATYAHKIDAFFGVWEYFQTYTVDDSFLKTRKVWPLH